MKKPTKAPVSSTTQRARQKIEGHPPTKKDKPKKKSHPPA
jgi:hypothetical protein